MTRRCRFLGDHISSSDSDFLLILAALICVLGHVAVARCSCLRPFRGSSTTPPPPSANKDLKKNILSSLPKLTVTAESPSKFSDCAICLTEFTAAKKSECHLTGGMASTCHASIRGLDPTPHAPPAVKLRWLLGSTNVVAYRLGAVARPQHRRPDFKQREDEVNRFLP